MLVIELEEFVQNLHQSVLAPGAGTAVRRERTEALASAVRTMRTIVGLPTTESSPEGLVESVDKAAAMSTCVARLTPPSREAACDLVAALLEELGRQCERVTAYWQRLTTRTAGPLLLTSDSVFAGQLAIAASLDCYALPSATRGATGTAFATYLIEAVPDRVVWSDCGALFPRGDDWLERWPTTADEVLGPIFAEARWLVAAVPAECRPANSADLCVGLREPR